MINHQRCVGKPKNSSNIQPVVRTIVPIKYDAFDMNKIPLLINASIPKISIEDSTRLLELFERISESEKVARAGNVHENWLVFDTLDIVNVNIVKLIISINNISALKVNMFNLQESIDTLNDVIAYTTEINKNCVHYDDDYFDDVYWAEIMHAG